MIMYHINTEGWMVFLLVKCITNFASKHPGYSSRIHPNPNLPFPRCSPLYGIFVLYLLHVWYPGCHIWSFAFSTFMVFINPKDHLVPPMEGLFHLYSRGVLVLKIASFRCVRILRVGKIDPMDPMDPSWVYFWNQIKHQHLPLRCGR